MKRFAQIYNKKAHWIFEAELMPNFAPDVAIVDISLNTEIKEGWNYDADTNTFSAPIIQPIVEPQVSSEEMQMQTLLNTEYLVIMSELTNL